MANSRSQSALNGWVTRRVNAAKPEWNRQEARRQSLDDFNRRYAERHGLRKHIVA